LRIKLNRNSIQKAIESGKNALGIELGSTRIKAVLIDKDHRPIASRSHAWENRYENYSIPLYKIITHMHFITTHKKYRVIAG
jgi:activator of 2-hydroxyglutaryl-CoA dehydratase